MNDDILRLAAAPSTRGLVVDLAKRLEGRSGWDLSRLFLRAGEVRAAVNLALAGVHLGEPAAPDHLVDLLPVVEESAVAIALLAATGDRLVETVLASCESGRNVPDRQALYLYLAATSLHEAPPPDDLLVSIRQSSRNPQTPLSRVLIGLAARAVGDADVLAVVGRMAEEADTAAARKIGDGFLRELSTPLSTLLPVEAAAERFGGFTVRREAPKVGRNDPCPCGSGRKYKRCCAGRESPEDLADRTVPSGDRARFHRTMSERQFDGLHPVELSRILPSDLGSDRLSRAMRSLARFRDFGAAECALEEYLRRGDRVRGEAFEDMLGEMLGAAVSSGDADAAERLLARFEDPEKQAPHFHLPLALIRKDPGVMERVETVARAALTDESGESAEFLGQTLLFFSPALGILVARGALASGQLQVPRRLIDRIEWARDELLLRPGDVAGHVHDLLAEQELDRQMESVTAAENEKLAAEAEELGRDLRGAKAREEMARRELARLERRLARADEEAARAREAAERAREGDGPDPEEVDRLRRTLERQRIMIEERNEQRRQLQEQLARLQERSRAEVREGGGVADDDEEENDGLETDEDAVPERLNVRFPDFTREFRDGVRSVASHVARDALSKAGAIAGADPTAWTFVKKVRAIEGLRSARLGRYRALFTLVGEDAIRFERLIHRRDLEATLRRMG